MKGKIKRYIGWMIDSQLFFYIMHFVLGVFVMMYGLQSGRIPSSIGNPAELLFISILLSFFTVTISWLGALVACILFNEIFER